MARRLTKRTTAAITKKVTGSVAKKAQARLRKLTGKTRQGAGAADTGQVQGRLAVERFFGVTRGRNR